MSASASAQRHQNHARGLTAEAYSGDSIDNVNLFNGNLTLTIPIGQGYSAGGGLTYKLTLVYNSNVWDLDDELDTTIGREVIKSVPDPKSNAGLGWRLALGTLLPPNTNNDDPEDDCWRYDAPDGSEHGFCNDTLHPDDPKPPFGTNVLYTRDGSYLRLKLTGGGAPEIEFPDGTIHRFASTGPVTQIRDRHGNFLNVDSSDPTLWRLTDRLGKTHTIHFNAQKQVTQVNLRPFNGHVTGAHAAYNFFYEDATVARHPRDAWRWPDAQKRAAVSLLRRVSLPADGGEYVFDYYHDNGGGLLSGAIKSLRLPTLGGYEWEYGVYGFDSSDPSSWDDPEVEPSLSVSEGVTAKKIYQAGQSSANTPDPPRWSYRQGEVGAATSPTQRVHNTTIVTTPEGDETINYFDATHKAWDYGLPYTRAVAGDGGFFLSREIYKGPVSGGDKVRSVFVRYERDKHEEGINIGFGSRRDFNRRSAGHRTRFHDDGNRHHDVTYSNFDGLGHYRQSTASGNFGAGAARTTFTNYNPGRGRYEVNPDTNLYITGTHNFNMLDWGAPWVLGTYQDSSVSEGAATAKRQYCFDQSNGLLLRERVLVGGSPGPRDVIVKNTYDASANRVTEEHYGGDRQTVNTGGLCGLTLPAGNQYQIDYTYMWGRNVATRAYNGTNFKAIDREIDQYTGLVSAEIDPSGIRVSYEYDALGRQVWVRPQAGHGAQTQNIYTPATSPSALATLTTRLYPNSGDTANVLAESKTFYDAFGRPTRAEKLMPDGSLSVQTKSYNEMGWATSLSESGRNVPGGLTRYQNYDAFGRPGLVTTADGKQTEIVHKGVRETSRRVTVGTQAGTGGSVVESDVWTVARRDQHGRLWRVVEDVTLGGPTPSQLNVAHRDNGGTVRWSSTVDPTAFPAGAVIDGDRAGANWGSGGGWNDASEGEYASDWVRVDFRDRAEKEVTEVRVFTLRDNFAAKTDDPGANCNETFATADNTGQGIVDFDVQYLSGHGWKTVPGGRVVGNNMVCRRITFPAVRTTAIRVAVHRSVAFTSIPNNYSRIVEVEVYGRALVSEQVWVEDSLPAGAVPVGDADGWNWVGANPPPFSGSHSHQSPVIAGAHQHYFYGATQTLTVNAGDTLSAYVYLDQANPPREVMLQWNSGGSWEHRAYWGENLIEWGVNETASRRHMGPLPPAGQWVRLEVPAALVGLEGRVLNGMAFSLFNGRATWDRAGKIAPASGLVVNVARESGARATASSQANSLYPVSAIIDGDRMGRNWGKGGFGSGWNDATEGVFASDWVQVNFSGEKTINEIDVFTLRDNPAGGGAPSPTETFSTADNEGSGITYFEVQYLSGGRWRTLDCGNAASPCGLVSGNNRVWRQFAFAPITTSAIRVVIRDAAVWTALPNNYSRVVEVEAWAPAPQGGDDVSGNVVAEYGYDVGGRLSAVTLTSPDGAAQGRSFSYDNRGFMLSETHPENGTTFYSDYDALGHAGRERIGTLNGKFDLVTTYDRAGRVKRISYANPTLLPTGSVLKEFEYGDEAAWNGVGQSRGRLRKAVRHNHFSGRWTADFPVEETYTYLGVAGAVSQRDTTVRGLPGGDVSFTQGFTYDDLGMVRSVRYPKCISAPCNSETLGTDRTVTFTNSRGFLTQIPGYAPNISYHANGLVSRLDYFNGVAWTQEIAAHSMARPARLATQNVVNVFGSPSNWNTGLYRYDGAGNIVNIGPDRFLYDSLLRLKEGEVTTQGAGKWRQRYAYDGFGNFTQIATDTPQPNGSVITDTRAISVSRQTNRDAGAAYDEAGSVTRISRNASAPEGWRFHFGLDGLNMAQTFRDTLNRDVDWTYIYTAGDERIISYNDNGSSTSAGTIHRYVWRIRDLSGNVLREYVRDLHTAPQWRWVKDYIYSGRKLVAGHDAVNGKIFFHLDHLGTPRQVTNASRVLIEAVDLLPFGEQATWGGGAGETMKFTGHERDANGPGAADDFDYMHARYYSPLLGHFLGVDPGNDHDPSRPQSWNKYAYVRNNPVHSVDPDGRALDVIVDVGFIAYDLFDIGRSVYKGEGVTKTQWLALGADVGGAIVPFATGAGAAVRASAKAASLGHDAVVVGESMTRVRAAAEQLNAKTFETLKTNAADMLTSNAMWLKKQIDSGATIYDIGLDVGRKGRSSKFSPAEVQMLQDVGYVRRFSGKYVYLPRTLATGDVVLQKTPVWMWKRVTSADGPRQP